MKKIIVIIVSYNGIKWIEECLSSVYLSDIEVEVVVIDNNSTDGTVNFIRSKFPRVVLFEQKENLGFGKANNIGKSYAIKQNADFVFLLNQDAFVNENAISNLVKTSQNHQDYGILSPIQLDYSGKSLEKYFHKFMAQDVSRTFYSDFVLKNEIKEIYEIEFVQAAAWLLPNKTLMEIGGFDPIFFHYGEDNNYCQRVLYHNKKIGVVPNSFIRHDSEKETRQIDKSFSDKDLVKYILPFLVEFGDINKPFTKKEIQRERKNIYKSILMNLLRLNLHTTIGLFKKLKLFNSNIIKIYASRLINKHISSNYLNV